MLWGHKHEVRRKKKRRKGEELEEEANSMKK